MIFWFGQGQSTSDSQFRDLIKELTQMPSAKRLAKIHKPCELLLPGLFSFHQFNPVTS